MLRQRLPLLRTHVSVILLLFSIILSVFAPVHADTRTPVPVTRKVALIVQTPSVVIDGVRAPLHLQPRFHDPSQVNFDPYALVNTLYGMLRQASGGYADYRTQVTVQSGEFPVAMNGFRYTADLYVRCQMNALHPDCPTKNNLDYAQLFKDYGLCEMIAAGQIDEVFLFGGPGFGYDEFAWKIPGDRMPYLAPTLYGIYESRKKNLPDCGRSYIVMGFNYAVGIENMLHSYGHRVESALTVTVGRGRWNACDPTNTWDRFTCNTLSNGSEDFNAGCGTVHTPPNATRDYPYEYDNPRYVLHDCRSWANYPDPPTVTVRENDDAWGGDERGYHQWWLSALPKNEGYTIDGNLRNWWAYLVDYDTAVSVLPLAPDLATAEVIRLAGTPLVGQTVVWGHRARNLGATDSNAFDVRWTISRDAVLLKASTLRHAPLGARKTDRGFGDASAQFSYTFTQPGRYRLSIVLDPEDRLLETDKSNNRVIRMTIDVP